MDSELVIAGTFIAGILLQAVYFMRGRVSLLPAVIVVVGLGLGGLALSVSGGDTFDRVKDIAIAYCCLPFIIAVFVKAKILPRLNEKVLLSYTISFAYLFFFFLRDRPLPLIPTLLLAAVVCAVMALSFSRGRLPNWVKFSLCVWLMLVILLTGLHQVIFSFVDVFASMGIGKKAGLISPAGSFFAGMAFCYLGAYSFYLYMLVPLPGKNETLEHRIGQWKRDVKSLVSRYDENVQMSPAFAGMIIALQGGLLGVNYFFRVLPAEMVINISLLSPMFFSLLDEEKAGRLEVPGQGRGQANRWSE